MVSGKAFRVGLRKPIPRLLNGQRKIPLEQQKIPLRVVPAFTVQSLQKNTIVDAPPRLNNMDERPVKPSLFRKHYLRGDFPINLEFDTFGNKIGWRVEIDKLDFHYYLPMFFDGLVETEVPYNFFAHQGIRDMLANGAHKVFPVLPQLIIPIKRALNTRNIEVICKTLRVLQELVKCDEMIGEALVPYYRQILPVFNLFKEKNINCGDKIDYTQRRKQNVGDLINETLELLERTGGEDAFINIKYMIPTYESCILN